MNNKIKKTWLWKIKIQNIWIQIFEYLNVCRFMPIMCKKLILFCGFLPEHFVFQVIHSWYYTFIFFTCWFISLFTITRFFLCFAKMSSIIKRNINFIKILGCILVTKWKPIWTKWKPFLIKWNQTVNQPVILSFTVKYAFTAINCAVKMFAAKLLVAKMLTAKILDTLLCHIIIIYFLWWE